MHSSPPLILYTTNTLLAYQIAQRYYGGLHYVWCTPHFDPGAYSIHDVVVPRSSCPREIHRELITDIRSRDRHSQRIELNKMGLRKGVTVKQANRVITADEAARILAIINAAELLDFKPLVYAMPYEKVRHLLRQVDVPDAASPLSVEYVIEALPRDHFDVLDFGEGA